MERLPHAPNSLSSSILPRHHPGFRSGCAAANQPYVIEYYYKVEWRHQQEFPTLFLKNHYPLLKKILETGRMTSIKIGSPRIIPLKTAAGLSRRHHLPDSTAATTANPQEETLIKQLYPD